MGDYDLRVMLALRDELSRSVAALTECKPVVVSGEAGIGKSTFLELVVNTQQWPAWCGGGLAGLRWHAYAPLLRALRRPMPRGDRLAVANYVAGRVGEGLLVLDDLQWCDSDTLTLLPLLAPRMRLLLSYRERDFMTEALDRQCGSLGATRIALGRLADDAAAEVVRLQHPELAADRVAQIVGLAGGNPRFLGDLSRTTRAANPERLAAGWLDACSAQAQDALAMLALIARPAMPETIGPGSSELAEAELASVDAAGLLSLTHGAVGKLAVDRLGPAERRARHALLAQRLTDPGEIARHAKAAGAPDVAARFAKEAAARATAPAERGRHLNLAASCVAPTEAVGLLVASAEASAETGDFQAVLDLADRIDALAPAPNAAAAVWRARAQLALGDPVAAQRAATVGLAARALSPAMQTALRIEEVRAVSMLPGRQDEALELAQLVVNNIEDAGEHPRALFALGGAQAAAGATGWEQTLTSALAAAERSAEPGLVSSIAHSLISRELIAGDTGRAAELAAQLADRAHAELQQSWYVEFSILRLWCDLFVRSDYPGVVQAATRLTQSVLPPAPEQAVVALLAIALMDTAEFTRAGQILDRAGASRGSAAGPMLCWAGAEFAWLTGDFVDAVTLARADEAAPAPLDALLAVTFAWAAWQCDGHATGSAAPSAPSEFGGSHAEIDGIARLSSDPFRAAETFAEAMHQWLPRQQRAARRAWWARAEAQRLAGDVPAALATLELLHTELLASGHTGLKARVDRSMRAAGRRRGAPRSAEGPGDLTTRERHVLGLVGAGLTSAEIAGRLQITAATVDGHIQSAVRKLGAANRRHAVALLASETVVEADQRDSPPYIVTAQRGLRASIEAELTRRGWRVVAGFTLAGLDFDVRDARVVCAGEVPTVDDRRAALIAGVRGAGVLLIVPEPAFGDDEFVNDLERLAVSSGATGVDWRDELSADGLTADMVALLRALATGSTVEQAARTVHLSLRGAHRRLATARTLLGVSTNQQAIAAVNHSRGG